jgi:hypothetical protein
VGIIVGSEEVPGRKRPVTNNNSVVVAVAVVIWNVKRK